MVSQSRQRGQRGITSVFHAFRLGKMHLVKKKQMLLFLFRLNYGNAANQNMFSFKVDM